MGRCRGFGCNSYAPAFTVWSPFQRIVSAGRVPQLLVPWSWDQPDQQFAYRCAQCSTIAAAEHCRKVVDSMEKQLADSKTWSAPELCNAFGAVMTDFKLKRHASLYERFHLAGLWNCILMTYVVCYRPLLFLHVLTCYLWVRRHGSGTATQRPSSPTCFSCCKRSPCTRRCTSPSVRSMRASA